jgi:hypothetical protein
LARALYIVLLPVSCGKNRGLTSIFARGFEKEIEKAFWQVSRGRNHVISNECEKSSSLQQATTFQDLSGLRPFEMTHLPLKMV